jgi:hypothetical protein
VAEQEMILDTDPRAATYRTDIKGWVARDGMFYGDGQSAEQTARYAGCTHRACERCGKPTTKHWLKCDDCRAILDRERFAQKPQAEWNGSDYLYSEALDEYFPDLSDAEDRLEEGQTLADLMLMICEPNYVTPLEDDYCCDQTTEDGDLPNAVTEAMDAFNKAVAGIVLSWSPGKFALKLPDAASGVDSSRHQSPAPGDADA